MVVYCNENAGTQIGMISIIIQTNRKKGSNCNSCNYKI